MFSGHRNKWTDRRTTCPCIFLYWDECTMFSTYVPILEYIARNKKKINIYGIYNNYTLLRCADSICYCGGPHFSTELTRIALVETSLPWVRAHGYAKIQDVYNKYHTMIHMCVLCAVRLHLNVCGWFWDLFLICGWTEQPCSTLRRPVQSFLFPVLSLPFRFNREPC